jgi:hypothetical protein
MTTLKLEWNQAEVRALQQVGYGKPVLRAMRKAGGDTIRAMRAAANRSVRFRKRMKASAVSSGLVLRMPRGGALEDLEWRIDVSGEAVPLSAYPHRQVKRGVSVAVNRNGRKIIQSAFVARMKSGHLGIFVRRGKGRLPIDELFSSRISDVIQDTGAIPAIFARGAEVFERSFARLLPLELSKFGAK